MVLGQLQQRLLAQGAVGRTAAALCRVCLVAVQCG